MEKSRLDLVVKGIIYDEYNDMSKDIDEIEISHVSELPYITAHHRLISCAF